MNGYAGSRIPRNIEAKVLDAQSNALNGPTGSRWNMGSLMMQRALLTESELWSLEQQVLVTCSIMEERLLYFSSFCLQTIFFLRKNLIKDNKAPLLELEKIAQWLRVLATLPEDLNWIPNTHTAAQTICNSNSRGFDAHFWLIHIQTLTNIK